MIANTFNLANTQGHLFGVFDNLAGAGYGDIFGRMNATTGAVSFKQYSNYFFIQMVGITSTGSYYTLAGMDAISGYAIPTLYIGGTGTMDKGSFY